MPEYQFCLSPEPRVNQSVRKILTMSFAILALSAAVAAGVWGRNNIGKLRRLQRSAIECAPFSVTCLWTSCTPLKTKEIKLHNLC